MPLVFDKISSARAYAEIGVLLNDIDSSMIIIVVIGLPDNSLIRISLHQMIWTISNLLVLKLKLHILWITCVIMLKIRIFLNCFYLRAVVYLWCLKSNVLRLISFLGSLEMIARFCGFSFWFFKINSMGPNLLSEKFSFTLSCLMEILSKLSIIFNVNSLLIKSFKDVHAKFTLIFKLFFLNCTVLFFT